MADSEGFDTLAATARSAENLVVKRTYQPSRLVRKRRHGFRSINFDLIYGLSYGGPGRSTTTLAFFSFQNGFQFQNYGYAAAVAYFMLLVLVIGTTVLLRYAPLRPRHVRLETGSAGQSLISC